MGNNQIKQSMKCFKCNEVALIDLTNENNPNFNIIITMKCINNKCKEIKKLNLKEYFDYRHFYRSQRIPCNKCSKHENEMFLCHKCQEISNKNNPIVFCPKCKVNHEQENPEHICLSMNNLNSQCIIHRKNYIAFDEEKNKNICEDCINDKSNNFNKEKIIYLENIKLKENEIEELLEKAKLQLAKINTIKMMNLSKDESETKKFKEYLQNKLYFIELEWLIIGEIVGTPNNYQVIKNINNLMENKYNTLKNNEIFNDEDHIGLLIKKIIDEKNSEKKVIYTPIKP